MTAVQRIIISFGLGFVSPIAFVLGAEPFEVSGASSVKEIAGGCIAVALWLAIGQYWIARKAGSGLRCSWPGVTTADLVLLGWFLFMTAAESPRTVISQGVPMLVSGCFGSLAGSVIAALQEARTKSEQMRAKQ